MALIMMFSVITFSCGLVLTAAEPTNGNVGLSDNGTATPASYGATPSKGQLDYHKSELCSFVHYGMNPLFSRELVSEEGVNGTTVSLDK